MLPRHRSVTLALAAAVVPLVGCKQNEEPVVMEAVTMTEGQDSTIYVEDDIWVALVDQPREHFVAARQHFVDRQWDAALADLEKSTAFLKLQTKHSTEADRARLRNAAREIDHVARLIRNRTLTDVAALDRALSSGYHALAQHFRARAAFAWSADKRAAAAAYLREAAWDTERGYERAGATMDADARAAVEQAKNVTMEMNASTMSLRIGNLNTAIHKLGVVVQSSNSS